MRYASRRHYTWSADIAYSVGLMASDGCLQKDGRHIDLTSTDYCQLENFARALGRDFSIGTKRSGSGATAYRIQCSDVAYYDFLLAAGLTPAKSKTIARLRIPDEYYADFLRGVFDGDGSCYAYMDPRWKSSFMYYVTFASASMEFIKYLQVKNSRLAHTGAGSIRATTRAHSLAYAKKDARALFSFIYYHPDIIYLQRKYDKLHSFTLHGQDAIIS